MSETVGYIDNQGSFRLKTTFDPKNPNDMEQMLKLLSEEESNAQVEHYGPDFVEVLYRPDDLSRYGF